MRICPSNNLIQIYNGVDLNYFNSKNKILIENKNIYNLLAVVHPVPHKGMHLLIEVLEFVCKNSSINFQCNILGWYNSSMDKKYVKYIEEKISYSCIKNNIRFVSSTDILSFYSTTDLVIHPSLNESFCYVIAESLAMQIPVIAFNVGALSELITNNISGYLIDPFDISTMGEKIIQLLNSPKLRFEFTQNGKKIIDKKFDGIKNMQIVANTILGKK